MRLEIDINGVAEQSDKIVIKRARLNSRAEVDKLIYALIISAEALWPEVQNGEDQPGPPKLVSSNDEPKAS